MGNRGNAAAAGRSRWLLVRGLVVGGAFAAGSSFEVTPLLWDLGPAKETRQFYYNRPINPSLIMLREQHRLDSIVAGATSDLERVQRITDWVHRQWKHKGDCPPQPNDPTAILRAAQAGGEFSCREYAYVTAGCLNALGIRSRVVEIMPKDVAVRPAGAFHVVCEAFLNNRKKWVMADAQWNAVPTVKGYPLNLVELQAVLVRKTGGLDFGGIAPEMAQSYAEGMLPYIYFLITPFDHRIAGTALPRPVKGRLMLVPLGVQVPAYFDSALRNGLVKTSNLGEFYGAPKHG